MKRPRKIAIAVGIFFILTDVWMNWPTSNPTLINQRAGLEKQTTLGALWSAHESLTKPYITPRPSLETSPQSQEPSEPIVLSKTDRALCDISRQTDIPLSGDLRVQILDRVDGGTMYSVKSSDCPAELYSAVWMDRQGRIEKEISCQRTSLTELALNSGVQANIEVVPSEKNMRPLAISGNARFLVQCPDTGLTLTRDGRFQLKNGALENSEGCIAWTRNDGGRQVNLTDGDPLDDHGCSETTRECLDLYEPDERDTDAFNFKTNKSLMVLNERGLRKSHSGMLFQSALEDLDTADRSLTGGSSWETTLLSKLPANCSD